MKTANSGYLTRRLVDVAQDCIIVEPDCGTERGLTVRAVMDGGEVVAGLSERTLGRTTAEDVLDPVSGGVLMPRNTLIEEPEAERIEQSGVESVKIRSVLTCESRVGVCAACYGRDLARGTPVNIGEAVGVIAAQSIGEPGTQLTMRTFHIGGAAQRGAEASNVEASHDGTVTIKNRSVVQNSQGYPVVMSRNCEIVLQDDKGRERARFRVPYGARLLADEGAQVKRNDKLAEWDPYTLPIITERAGQVEYLDLLDGVTLVERMDEVTGLTSRVVVDYKQAAKGVDLRPRLQLKDTNGEVLKAGCGRLRGAGRQAGAGQAGSDRLRQHRRDRVRADRQGDPLHDKIRARWETVGRTATTMRQVVVTTPGRMLIAQILPKNANVPFSLINRTLTKKNVSDVIDAVYRHCGQKECVIFADRLMGLGFGQAAKAGLSFGKDDLIIPDSKPELILKTQNEVKEFEQQYQDGLITAGERYNKVVDAWSRCTDEVAGAMMKEISRRRWARPPTRSG